MTTKHSSTSDRARIAAVVEDAIRDACRTGLPETAVPGLAFGAADRILSLGSQSDDATCPGCADPHFTCPVHTGVA